MSATIDSAKFMNFFDTDALINIEGRSFPTEVYNLFSPIENYLEGVFNSIMQIHSTEEKGDILAFLTGED
jgi:HrpA-like RNA helicase